MKKKLLAILLTVCMVLSMAPTALAADSVFTDVNAGDWFAEEVKYVYDNGLMNGVGDNAFDPSGTVTRAMVWTTLARLDGVNTAGSDPWWLAGQKWAMENGISDGTMATENITREQLVTMIWRYAKYIDMDVSEGEDTNILSYTDAFGVNEWAISAMQWACAVGIINGIDGALQPQGYATRAQLAAILYRFVEEVVDAAPATYTVTFMWNYGNKGVYETVDVESGKTVGSLRNPSRGGYSFSGWYTEDGDRFTLNTKVTADIVVYAKWSEYVYIPTHTHNYGEWEANGDCTHSQKCSCGAAITNDCDEYSICAVCGFDRLTYVLEHGGTVTLKEDATADEYLASANAEVTIKLDGKKLDGAVSNDGNLTINGAGTMESAAAGLVDKGTATLKDITMKAGSPTDYAVISRGGNTTLENVDVESAGGGVGAADGAKLVFNGGKVAVNTESTSGRYNFYAEGEGTEITIKSGDFSFSKTLNQKRAYIYAGAGATVKVEGGNFGPASKRAGYTDGIMGDGTVIITGGTFGFDPTKWVAEGYYAAKEGDVWTIKQCESHTFSTEAGYHTCDNCSFTEMCTPKVTDGDAVTCAVCGADYVVAAEATFALENVTINNDGAGVESFGSVTLKDVVMNAGSPADYAVIIKDGEAALENVEVTSAGGGVGVVGGAKAVFDDGSVAVNTTSTSGRYNFYVVGEGTELTIKDGDFSFSKTLNQKRAYIYAGSGATVYIEGGNFGPASKRDGYTAGIMGDGTVVITGGTFGFDPTNWVAEGYEAVKSGDIWTVSPVMMMAAPFSIRSASLQDANDTGFYTLQEAISKAENGDTISLTQDISVDHNFATELDIPELNYDIPSDRHVTLFNVAGKSITIDLNGHNISIDVSSLEEGVAFAGIFSTSNGGHLTLMDSDGGGVAEVNAVNDDNDEIYANVYAMIINLDDTSSIVIESGTYRLDRAVSSMIDTRSNEGVIVNGGTFYLDNVGDPNLKNGQAWTFNAKGQNTRHVIVTGGTFPADIQHQYYPFEVSMAKELALQYDEGTGMYTVVPAVAYVNEQEFSGRWYTNEVGYATMEEAYAAVEPPKTSWDGQVSEQEYVTSLIADYYGSLADAFGETNALEGSAGASVSVSEEDGKKVVTLLSDVELTETLNIVEDATLVLNGHEITNGDNVYISPAIRTNADVVIDGTAEGSAITVNAPAGEKGTVLSAKVGTLTVNGGTYTSNTSGAGTLDSYNYAVYTYAGTELNVNSATILAKDTGDKAFTVGINALGDAVLTNTTVIAEANYMGNATGNNYGSASRGIYSTASLELYDCYIWGAHSGVTTTGSVYVDGGTYEGYGHGGFYLAGGSKTSHFYNATISWSPMREGFEADTVAGTNGAGMYISQASYIKAYFDNCKFNMNEGNASQNWDGDKCPLYAIAINNGYNEVYVSNCHIEHASRVAFRLQKTYTDRYVYYGVGNTYNEENVVGLITSSYESHLVETGVSYAKAE